MYNALRYASDWTDCNIPRMEAYIACLREFDGELHGAEFGVAYGGALEEIAAAWKKRGHVWGFDTFTGMPKELVTDEEGRIEADCLDVLYREYGTEKLGVEYQRAEFARLGLNNVTLVKGLVTADCCREIPYLHYACLDLDLNESMRIAYAAVKDRLVPGGYLLLHDYHSMPRNAAWIDAEVITDERWEVLSMTDRPTAFVVLRRQPRGMRYLGDQLGHRYDASEERNGKGVSPDHPAPRA